MTVVCGDVRDPALFASLFSAPFDVVYHLAASLTVDAENNFELGMGVNNQALIALLECCRAQRSAPTLLFASSISIFGGALPAAVDDLLFQAPQTSYGAHKVIAEQLINDYSRRGYIDGRVLRLPIVLTYLGPPTDSVSDRIAALIREPLAGRQPLCQLEPAPLAVASVDKVIAALLKLSQLPASVFSTTRMFNMPALTVTPLELSAATTRAALFGAPPPRWQSDPEMQRIVDGWPTHFTSQFARTHGIEADRSADAIVASYLRHIKEPHHHDN